PLSAPIHPPLRAPDPSSFFDQLPSSALIQPPLRPPDPSPFSDQLPPSARIHPPLRPPDTSPKPETQHLPSPSEPLLHRRPPPLHSTIFSDCQISGSTISGCFICLFVRLYWVMALSESQLFNSLIFSMLVYLLFSEINSTLSRISASFR
ncbi:hypothetical protein LINPERPRIM_LOCUS5616, partial [Linum perenne]